jgi:hypothetical protein
MTRRERLLPTKPAELPQQTPLGIDMPKITAEREVNGVRLHYVVFLPEQVAKTDNLAVSKVTVVLLHGWPETCHAWHLVAPNLRPKVSPWSPQIFVASATPNDRRPATMCATSLKTSISW